MKSFPLDHELTVPLYRWPHTVKCVNPFCESGEIVRVRGEACARCAREQLMARAAFKRRFLERHA